ncbi:ATP-binding cassette domain-containing protein [Microbacterium sp. CJ88]|uniref:ATP-binding cassette domain-containing protein n=1 Tax=Microbacterium sp. CJ88 TaxID=3445672 RepID=UPI003F6592A5
MRVELRDVGHRFGEAPWLFRGLSFEFETGRTYALTGPSGSGKSSLLALIAGWTQPAEGAVDRVAVRKSSWVFQNSHGTPRRTALDHIVFPLLVAGSDRRAAEVEAKALLARFSLEVVAARPFRELSGGEAQRLMLARAVAAGPDLLLVDEPTAQLDAATSYTVNSVLSEISAEGRVVIVATHDPETVEACTDRIDLARWAPPIMDFAAR